MGQKGAKESEVEKHLTKCLANGAKESKLKELFNTMDTYKIEMLTRAQFTEFATAYVNMVQKKIAGINIIIFYSRKNYRRKKSNEYFSVFHFNYLMIIYCIEKNLGQVELSFIEPKDLDEFVVKLFHSIDKDKNGNISFEEFVQFMRSDISEVVSNAKSQKIVCWMHVAIVGLRGII
jgi:Ca2+-binding EF-hand superfamily protein